MTEKADQTNSPLRAMRRCRRTLAVALLCGAVVLGLYGCAASNSFSVSVEEGSDFTEKHYNFNTSAFLTADDEIVTYDPADTEKIPLVVASAGSVNTSAINERFAQLHPECQIVSLNISAGSTNALLPESLEGGRAPDVLYIATDQIVRANAKDLYEDLAGNSVTQNYHTSALQSFSDDGSLYFLPGPSAAYGMWYNKTLFDEHGWTVPTTFDEFVALCTRIQQETDGQVTAFDPNAKYSQVLDDALIAFSYGETLASMDDATWLHDFKNGSATFLGHMEPLFEAVQQLADAGVLNDANWQQSSTKRMNSFYAGDIAMINISNEFTRPENSSFEFAPMTFPGTAVDQDYLINLPSYAITLPLQQTQRTSEKQALVNAYLEFASSAEAQSLFIGQASLTPSVKDLSANADERTASTEVRAALDGGRLFAREDFSGPQTPVLTDIISEQSQAIVNGDADPAEACAAIDAYCKAWRADELPDNTEVLAKVTEDFTILETSEYMADKMRQKTGADVALLLNNHIYRGNLIPLFEGELTTTHADDLRLRSLTSSERLRTVRMTGEQLLSCLDHPYDGTGTDDADCVYAFSGLKATVAPWAPVGQKMREVKLADGSDIDPNATYTVAVWGKTVHEEYATDVVKTFEGDFSTFLADAFLADGTVSPDHDNRMTLVWD